jgi:ABC-type multidrug transport system fused ATPase/permease subunit
MEALDELMKGRTTVIIAHSLEAIRKADHIIVLRDGRVEASGSPKQVLENSNSYLNKVMQRRAQSAV